MSPLERRMIEDREVRDAALRLFKADLGLIRGDLDDRSIGARLSDRVGDATMDMLDEAVDYAEANRGKVAAGVAAAVLWFARGPILDALGRWLGVEYEDLDEDEEPAATPARSRKEQ